VAARYREDVTAAPGARGRPSQRRCRPGCGHTHGRSAPSVGASVAIGLAASLDSCSGSARPGTIRRRPCDGP